MYCSELTLVKDHVDYTELRPLPCNRWSCEYCAPNRKRSLIAQAMSGKPTTFITLTANPAFALSQVERRRDLSRTWNIVVKRAKREFHLKSFPYFAVVERTKRGEPHLHILARIPFIPQRWLSEQMRELINSPIVDIRAVNDLNKAVFYISKYIGKEPAQFGTMKRYWHSRDWEQDRGKADERLADLKAGWRVVRSNLDDTLRDYRRRGIQVREIRPGHFAVFDAEQWEAWIEDRMRQIEREADERVELERFPC